MRLAEVIFTDNLPSIDLHGYDRDSARVKTLEFINDNIKMKNEVICVVHGIGSGILKNEIYKMLSKHNNVLEYQTHYRNNGMTLILLNIAK